MNFGASDTFSSTTSYYNSSHTSVVTHKNDKLLMLGPFFKKQNDKAPYTVIDGTLLSHLVKLVSYKLE